MVEVLSTVHRSFQTLALSFQLSSCATAFVGDGHLVPYLLPPRSASRDLGFTHEQQICFKLGAGQVRGSAKLHMMAVVVRWVIPTGFSKWIKTSKSHSHYIYYSVEALDAAPPYLRHISQSGCYTCSVAYLESPSPSSSLLPEYCTQ